MSARICGTVFRGVQVDKKQISALATAGVVVATMAALGATLLSSSAAEAPATDTVPVGQLVEVPTSSAPTISTEQHEVASEPIQKDTAVNAPAQPPAPQTVQAPVQQPDVDNGPAAEAPAEPTFTHPPYEPTGPGDTAPAPPPPAPCYVDENGRDICP
jgi:type IV secretory pathway VirB10-like protein